jgi:hypothetical protein
VNGADQRPFGGDFVDAAQQELSKPSRLFDLAENRFHNRCWLCSARPFCEGKRVRQACPPTSTTFGIVREVHGTVKKF